MTNQLPRVIRQAVPDVVERVYPGWKLVGYRAIKDYGSHYFCFVAPFEDKVVLGFEHGKMLTDPYGLLVGGGTQVRQVVIRKKGDIGKSKIIPLILEAAMIATERKQSSS